MFSYLQKIGQALMVPVSILPAAAVLMGIGYWLDPSGWGSQNIYAAFFIKAGSSLIDNMGVLFAIGIAFGLSKGQDGTAALAGMTAWLIITTMLSPGSIAQLQGKDITDVSLAFSKIQNQFIGILCGITAAELFNKFHKTELPAMLAFFSGKRLVPIITAVVSLILSFLLMYIWPILYNGLITFGITITKLGPIGAGIFGFLNRLLIPLGLHHALNSVFWFDVAGINDIGNFWGNTGTKGITGMYQAGFFPIMMFGLVGAVAAFIKTSYPENKNKVKSIMLAAAFASFFTGITEPIEFSFMFLAPGLYLIHAVLTGLSLYIAAAMHWIAGFGFSAGLIDFVLSSRLPLANQPYMLLVLGIIFFFIYYFLFTFIIQKFNLPTNGRENYSDTPQSFSSNSNYVKQAEEILLALGRSDNISNLSHCATRLRLEIVDISAINEEKLKLLSKGIIKGSKNSLQIIIGPSVQFLADEINTLLDNQQKN
ncbi:MAG: N-acetylglucosamine-specific PTS transporter subunit IIBC [Brevinemataceae bacterium]